MKSKLFQFLRLGVAGLLLYLLWRSEALNFGALKVFWVHPEVILLVVFSLLVVNNTLGALRLMLLLRANGVPISTWRVYLINWIGFFFSAVLPGTVTMDGVRGIYLIRAVRAEHQTDGVQIT